MNIFISSDSVFNFDLDDILNSNLEIDYIGCNILTTDRRRDKPFVSYALMKGLDFKVYSVQGYIDDNAIKKLALNIDKLYLFSDMDNYFYNRLFKYCDEIVYVGKDKYFISDVKSILISEFEKKLEKLEKKKKKFDYFNLYKEMVLDKLRSFRRIEIIIKNIY